MTFFYEMLDFIPSYTVNMRYQLSSPLNRIYTSNLHSDVKLYKYILQCPAPVMTARRPDSLHSLTLLHGEWQASLHITSSLGSLYMARMGGRRKWSQVAITPCTNCHCYSLSFTSRYLMLLPSEPSLP